MLFGTDGIRGLPGQGYLKGEEIVKVAGAFSKFLGKNSKVGLCRDTRASGPDMESSVISGLTLAGSDAYSFGVLNTPAAAFLSKTLGLDGVIIVSASHNPANENGLKFFSGRGTKLSVGDEEEIEKIYLGQRVKNSKAGKIHPSEEKIGKYVDFAVSTSNKLKLKAVLDCSNGAAYKTAPEIFKKIGLEITILNDKPNGKNINDNCGSEHPESLQAAVRKSKADVGIALDGDADRTLLVDETGKVLTGDQLIGLCALSMKKRGKLAKNKVVVTHYSNFGLEKALSESGISVVRADVGDRAVAEMMTKVGANLGGEQSGHLIFSDLMPTGDGILTAIQVLNVITQEKLPLSKLASRIVKVPQVLINVDVLEKKPYPKLEKEIALLSKGFDGRIFVRYSGTQNMIRIMVEGKSEKQINDAAQKLAREAREELG